MTQQFLPGSACNRLGFARQLKTIIFEIDLQGPRCRLPNTAVDNFSAIKNQIAVGPVMTDYAGDLPEPVDVVSFHDKERDVTAIASHPDPRRSAGP